ncbi:hypothetical protein M9458_007899, partial [Cirrhinus mrigala]
VELKSRIAWGRNDLLNLNLLLKLLLCLEMILCSGCSGLSMIDKSLLNTRRSATDNMLSISVPTTEPAFLTSLSRRET